MKIDTRLLELPSGSRMWTQENRDRYDRSHLRYPSDSDQAERREHDK